MSSVYYAPLRSQDLAHLGTLSEPNAGLALHEKDVFGIALRHLEEDLQ